jgi:hypothetical protein
MDIAHYHHRAGMHAHGLAVITRRDSVAHFSSLRLVRLLPHAVPKRLQSIFARPTTRPQGSKALQLAVKPGCGFRRPETSAAAHSSPKQRPLDTLQHATFW